MADDLGEKKKDDGGTRRDYGLGRIPKIKKEKDTATKDDRREGELQQEGERGGEGQGAQATHLTI